MAYTCIFLSLTCLILTQVGLMQAGKLEIPKPKISKDCELDGICDSVSNYPTELVEELIKRLGNESAMFSYDKFQDKALPNLSLRSSFGEEEPSSLCSTKPRSLPALAAKDKYENWRFIINNSKKPIQVFHTETCKKHLDSCSDKIGFGPGYDGACIQKVVFREMFYLKEETREIGRDYFQVPTCCSCSLIRKDNFK